jgi:glycosyltransferase involved in cell wall biosynthesis
MVARFQRVKGHHTFLEVARRILDTMPQTHFIIAGEDTFGVARDVTYRQTIIDTIQQDSRLRAHVHLLGFRPDVQHVLQAADVVVCPSQFESYGKVNLEAMACAVPVVSSNQGGPSETVKDGETGYLVAPDDVRNFSQAILALLQDPQKRAHMGQQGREWVQQQFSAEEMVQRYEAIFSRLLSQHD